MVLAVLGFGLIASGVAFATTSLGGEHATYYCDAVTVRYSISSIPFVQFRVVKSGNVPVSPVVDGTGNTTASLQQYTLTIGLNTEQSDGTMLKVQTSQEIGRAHV